MPMTTWTNCCRGWPMSSPDSVVARGLGLTVSRFPCRGQARLDMPLVLLHGWAADRRTWQPLAEKLSESFDVQTLDLPGFGDSPAEAGESTEAPDRLAATLERLAAALPERCVLVGWSLGGMLATLLAQRLSERIAGLITIASNACYVVRPDWPNAMPLDTFESFRAAFVDNAAACLKRFAVLQAHGDDESRVVTRQLREWQHLPDGPQQVAWSESLDLLRALDLRSALQVLEVPSLHLFGAGDALVPVAAASDFPTQGHRQVHIMEGCGHAPHISQPRRVAGLMEAFLADVTRLPEAGRSELLDKQSVARSFSRAAAQYDSAAHLQRRLGEQLSDYLPAPGDVKRVVDLGCGTGYFLPALQKMYPTAQLLACDLAWGMVAHARQQRSVAADWLC